MLQFAHTLLTLLALHQSLYFGLLALLACIVCPGWFTLGRVQLASVSTSRAPRQPRAVFVKRDHAVLILFARLAIVGKIESHRDLLALTLAVKIT